MKNSNQESQIIIIGFFVALILLIIGWFALGNTANDDKNDKKPEVRHVVKDSLKPNTDNWRSKAGEY